MGEEDRVGAPELTDEFVQNTLDAPEEFKFDDKRPPVGHVPVYDIEQSHRVDLDKAKCKKCGNVVKWPQTKGYKCENVIEHEEVTERDTTKLTFVKCDDVDDPLKFVS